MKSVRRALAGLIALALSTLVFSTDFVAASSVIGNPGVANPLVMTIVPPVNLGVVQPAQNSQAVTPAFRPPISPFTIFKIPGFIPVRPPGFNPFLRPNLFFNSDNPFVGDVD